MRPVKLEPDNFTPPTRTPWGGTKIVGRYKATLGLQLAAEVVGESWEVSVEPSFPSRLSGTGGLLADAIASDPAGWLGDATASRFGGQTPLLVKLLDSADNLSVQVHPRDGDPALAADESGKPEGWLVLEAEPGAGIYLGFKDGVTRDDVERSLRARGALDELLNFVQVVPGDAFIIDAGTPHAIGAGVTLVEPQFVRPGRRGVTYRFWDWNRLYDVRGRLSQGGEPRELHVDRSLAVTAWEAPRGAAFVATCRCEPRSLPTSGSGHRDLVIDWPWFTVERWRGDGALEVLGGSMWAVVCVAGRARLGELDLQRGESAVIPAGVASTVVAMSDTTIIATRVG